MSELTLPPSISIYEAEERFREPDLDLDYVDRTAGDVAGILAVDGVAEVAYQPGDGTAYRLLFVPLRLVRTAAARIVDGEEWDARAVPGMLDAAPVVGSGIAAYNAHPYAADGYLVARVEGTAYPLRLGRRGRALAASYVEEHWGLPSTSAVSVALLLRAVSYHLDAR